MAQRSIKIVSVGDADSAKTSMLYTYEYGSFPDEYAPTIFENSSKLVKFDDDGDIKEIDLNIWDTAGQEQYQEMRPLAYQGVDLFLVCFSVVSRDSFSSVTETWIPEIRRYAPRVPAILVGTKIDLRDDPREAIYHERPITFQQGAKCAATINAVTYLECSAKLGEGIEEIFNEAIRTILHPKVESKSKQFFQCCLAYRLQSSSHDDLPTE